jgi:hypothetical protein
MRYGVFVRVMHKISIALITAVNHFGTQPICVDAKTQTAARHASNTPAVANCDVFAAIKCPALRATSAAPIFRALNGASCT